MGDKLGADDKAKIEEAIADLKRALEAGELEAIKEKTEAVIQAGLVRWARMLLWGRVEQGHGTQGPGFAGAERATGAISTRRFFARPASSVLAATGCSAVPGSALA